VPPKTIPGPDQLKLVPDVELAERVIQVVVQVRVPPVALAPGATLSSFTDAVAVLVQPLEVFVTVTVYVPVALTVGLDVVPPETIPVPDQLNVVPLVGAADNITDVVVQVSVPPVVLAPGGTRSSLTSAVAVLVQPLDVFVTVTVYVPVALTLGFGVVSPETIPGPDQLNVVPYVGAADKTTEVVVHVSVPPVALAPGGVLLRLTYAVAVLVQPVAASVTVTVYVPEALTVGLAEVLPETIPVPDQL